MKISIPKETTLDETRVAATPQSVKELIKAGYEVNIETGAGTSSFISDDDFKNAGANIVNTTNELFKDSDINGRLFNVFRDNICFAKLLILRTY